MARSDGRDLVVVTPDALDGLQQYSFSPDGRTIVFASGSDADKAISIANVDGSGVRHLEVGMPAFEPIYLPPNGIDVIFTKSLPNATSGLYAVNIQSGIVRTIVAPATGAGLDSIRVSPDGSRIAYSAADLSITDANSYRIHVVSLDGTTNLTLPMPPGAIWEDAPSWSNDSTRLIVTRGYAAHNRDVVLAVVPADGSGVGVETARGLTGCCDTTSEWAPDDQSILTEPEDLNGAPIQQLLVYPATGATQTAPWAAISVPAWQRIAP